VRSLLGERHYSDTLLGEDPYAYVLGTTELTSLEALNRYQIEQGLMKRALDIRSLFVLGTV
jgi:hypothetical protein